MFFFGHFGTFVAYKGDYLPLYWLICNFTPDIKLREGEGEKFANFNLTS